MKQMKGQATIAFLLIIVIIIAAVFVLNWLGVINLAGLALQAVPGGAVAAAACPDTKLTAVTYNVFNDLNTTAAENVDVVTVFTSALGHTITLTDTTAPTSTNFNCGETYTGRGVSSSGAGGDHGNLLSVRQGQATLDNGNVVFELLTGTVAIDVGSSQHGRIEARVFDADEAAFMYSDESGDGSSAGTYRTTGAQFQSTTNATAKAIGSGGTMDIRMDIRINTNADEQLEDKGWYLFIDSSRSVWDVPGVAINGVAKTSNCALLNSDEAKKYNGEDFCYKITDISVKNVPRIPINLNMKALAGVDPGASDDFNITIVSIGTYQSTADNKNVKVGAVKDDSSQTVVLNEEEYLFDVS